MNLPNNISLFRILLVPVFVILLSYHSPERHFFHSAGVFVFLVACATDGADGYLARKLQQKTTLGSYLDPIADKLLLLSGFFSLSLMPNLPASMHIPAWVAIPVIARDIIILIGSTMIFLLTGGLKVEPLFIGKITTVFQMLTLFFSLIVAPEPVRVTLFICTLLLTILSGARYIQMGERLLR